MDEITKVLRRERAFELTLHPGKFTIQYFVSGKSRKAGKREWKVGGKGEWYISMRFLIKCYT